jgi:hypothetical protein
MNYAPLQNDSLAKYQWDIMHDPAWLVAFDRDKDANFPRTTFADEDISRFISLYRCAVNTNSSFTFYRPGYPNYGGLQGIIDIDSDKKARVSIILNEDLIDYKPHKNGYINKQDGNEHLDFGKFSIGVSSISKSEFINYLESNENTEKAASEISRLLNSNQYKKAYELLYQASPCILSQLPYSDKIQILRNFSNEVRLDDFKDHIVISIIESINQNSTDVKIFYEWLRNNPSVIYSLSKGGVDDEQTNDNLCELLYRCFNIYYSAQAEYMDDNAEGIYYIWEQRDKTLIQSQYGLNNKLTIVQNYPGKVNKNLHSIDPMAPVGLLYADFTNDPAGEHDMLVYMPAIYLKYLRDNKNLQNLKEFLVGAANAAGVFSGSGLLINGGKTILRIVGVIELLNATANITIYEPTIQNKLKETEDGRKFLELWPTISIMTDVATLSIFISSARASLNQIGNSFEGVERRAIQGQIDRAETIINDVAKGGTLASKLTGTLKSAYDDLIKSGLKAEEKANSILLRNTKGETVAIIYNNKITPVIWKSEFEAAGYTKQITDEGYWILKKGDDIAFDLGFKNGRKLTAEEANDFLVNSGRAQKEGQPYLVNTQVEEIELQVGEKFYVVETFNGGSPSPGGFATKTPITTVTELREQMAVLEEWKNGELVLREYTVTTPIRVRSGIIGPQLEKTGINAGKTYPGGAHQYEFIDDLRGDNWIKFVDKDNIRTKHLME